MSQTEPKFRALVLAENGGHHVEYSKRGKIWLDQVAGTDGFAVDYIHNTDPITRDFLTRYALVIQLDYAPYAWTDGAAVAFVDYIEQGKGGWAGFHHASLLGDFDGYPMWQWFSDFLGGIRYDNYIASLVQGTVNVEDATHPVMQGVPASFAVTKEEWYTYDRSPRSNVHVLASVDESTYEPDSPIKMGDHPVVWTNPNVPARNIYIFMGHSPDLFDNEAYTTLFRNAVLWAGNLTPPAPYSAQSPSQSGTEGTPCRGDCLPSCFAEGRGRSSL